MLSFEDTLREQYVVLLARKEAILSVSQPLRDAYDAKRAEIEQIVTSELSPIEAAMHEAEAGLYEVSNDIAAVARALKGRTGPQR